MSSEMVSRPIHVYSLPLANGVSILHPERAVVKFGRSKTVDIGILCYAKRTIPDRETRSTGRKVILDSLIPSRIERVRRLLSHIFLTAETSGLRMETLRSQFSRLSAFINWADTERWPDVLSNAETAKPAIRAYVEHLRDRVTRNDLSVNAAAKQQKEVVRAVQSYFGIDDLGRGLNLLMRDYRTAEVTTPPSEESQGRVLSLCDCLFKGISDFILGGLRYPYGIKMPGYLSLPKNLLWIFPGRSWFKTPAMVFETAAHAGFDYLEGRMATSTELKQQYPTKTHRWSQVAARKKKLMEQANENINHSARLHLAAQAINMFIILFLAATGMNWSQVVQLTWANDYEVAVTKQGFRAIKWRADGRVVSFELPIDFLPTFKRFLMLRTYLLQRHSCDHLFFSRLKKPPYAGPILSTLHRAYPMLRRIDPELSTVMPREWRAAKSDWLIRNTDPSTASLILQTSERTLLNHYAQGSQTVHHEEMSRFLSNVASTVLAPEERLENSIPRAVGACTSFGMPGPVTDQKSITPDCKNVEGCLFCDKFKVHADEVDTRKLISCRYVVNLTSPLSDSEEAFNALLHPILARLDELIEIIADKSPSMVHKLKKEVEEDGELDVYWAAKVEMLMTLGMI